MADSNDDYWENWNNDSKGSHNKSYNDTPTKSYKINKVKKQPKKRKSNIFKGIFALLIAAGLIIAVFFTPIISNLQTLVGGGNVYPEKADFTIKREINIETTGEINYNVDIPVPQNISGNDIQTIESIEWGGNPTSHEKFGQKWMIWSGELKSSESKDIVILYDVKTTTVDWGYSSDNSGKISDISQSLKDRYNHNQWQLDRDRDNDGEDDWMIQPENPKIENLAQDITSGKDNIYEKSKAIYNWINENIEYERGSTSLPKHALMTLREGSGDCDEQTFLYCSLARALGMPAWTELGILNDRVLDTWAGHGWIRQQFVSDEGGGGWVNIDLVNDQFFARDAQRVTSWVDDGQEGHLEDYYLFLNYTYSGNPRVTYNDEYITEDMETEGQVVLGNNGDSIPGFEAVILGLSILFGILIYKKDWRKR
ncbi:MAG: transglutaminase-like domain-containing protein [Thermoplasmatota archaeon]